jgi:hypothetical protein
VLLFQFKKIKPEEKLGWEEKLQTEPQVIEVTDGAKYIEENDGLMHSELGAPPWSNIYSRKFLQNNGLRFEMYKMYFEDTIFNWKVFVKAKKEVVLSNIVYYWIQYPTSESHTREFDRRLAKHINDVKASILMKQLAQQIKKEYPNRPLLYQLAMGASYEFQFILWAFAIKNKGLDHKTAIRLLREGKQNGAYPISHIMPDMMDYPSKAKILYFLISWEPILRLMLLLRSTKSVK